MTRMTTGRGTTGRGDAGQWVVDPDGRKIGRLEMVVGAPEDIEAATLVGASATQLFEFSIHRRLDELGVPREGRNVDVSVDNVSIDMPTGWLIVNS
jgi:hypothetical protein